MATNYTFKGEGYAIAFDAPGMQCVRRRLDIPDLIANGGLALKATPTVAQPLPATGFASGDTLDIFHFHKGTVIKRICDRLKTAEGAQCTIDVGITGGDTDGFLDGVDMNGTPGDVYYTTDALGYGTDNLFGYFCAADKAVTIIFNDAATNAFVADFWAEAYFAADLDAD